MLFLRSLACLLIVSSAVAAQEKAKQTVIKIDKKTTYITEPLDKDGYVDYIEAVNLLASKGVTPKNNYEVVVRQVMGPEEISESFRAEYYRRLGIPLPEGNGTWFVGYPQYAGIKTARGDAQQAILDEFDRLMEKPWKGADFPRAAKWLESVEKQLDALVDGSKRPHNYTPYLSGPEDSEGRMMIAVLLPSIQQQRAVGRALQMRAMSRIGEGEIDGAWNDIQAIRRVGRHCANGITLIEYLVGIALDAVAFGAEQQVLHAEGLTDQQARQFLAEHRKLKPMSAAAEKINVGERYMGLDAVQYVARHGEGDMLKALKLINDLSEAGPAPRDLFYVSADDGDEAKKKAKGGPDWNVTMEIMNDWYDRLVEAAREKDVARRHAMFEKLEADLTKLRGEVGGTKLVLSQLLGGKAAGRTLGNTLVVLLLPAVQQVTVAEETANARLDVMRLALAAEVYRREKGTYPKTLGDLAPAYVKSVPHDPHTDEPLHVRAGEKGFLVYSVGRNLKDDGGRGYDERKAGEDFDDIAVRLGEP